MAQDEKGKSLTLPGQQDLKIKYCATFRRIWRRSAARAARCALCCTFCAFGFAIAPETLELMQRMVINGELQHLVAERVWQETQRALLEKSDHLFSSATRLRRLKSLVHRN